MRRLALLSVFPPARGGLADYTGDLAAQLAPHFHVVGYTLGGPGPSASGIDVRDIAEYRGDEELLLVQVANTAELSFVLPWLPKADLITIHDACQHDMLFPFFAARPLRLLWESLRRMPRESRRPLWQAALRHGPRGAIQVLSSLPARRELYPFTRSILQGARRVVVHSRYLADHVNSLRPEVEVAVVPHGVFPVPPLDLTESRRLLGARLGRELSGTLLLAAFGLVQAHKRHTPVLEALARHVGENADVLYVILGARDPDYDLDAEIARLGLARHVAVVEDYPSLEEVNGLLAGADLLFSLRYPTLGSTSGALFKGLALGLPAAVTEAGSFRELVQAGIAVGVPDPGGAEVDACLALMREAQSSPRRLREVGERGRRYVESECAWPRVAARYAQILEAV